MLVIPFNSVSLSMISMSNMSAKNIEYSLSKLSDIHARHLLQHLKHSYTVSEDWTGYLYVRITLDWAGLPMRNEQLASPCLNTSPNFFYGMACQQQADASST